MLIESERLPEKTPVLTESEKLLGHIPALNPGAFLQGVMIVFSKNILVGM